HKVLRDNAVRLSSDNESQSVQLTNSYAKLTRWGYRLMAIGASIGFGAFKLYSTVHVIKMIGITGTLPISIIGAIAFVSMTIMTGVSSGVRIWDSGEERATAIEKGEIYDFAPAADHNMRIVVVKETHPGRYFLANGLTEMSAIFNAIASYMGMSTLSGAICSLFPPITVVVAPLFVGLGIAVAACRYVDFREFYGPKMRQLMGAEQYETKQLIQLPIKQAQESSWLQQLEFTNQPTKKVSNDFLLESSYLKLFEEKEQALCTLAAKQDNTADLRVL
ncbi:MAG: hypothetical protein KDH94_04495, partial [Coxiellaceae bacterium]|nr:hypothetical protein [Coxiellaceae bacterium]